MNNIYTYLRDINNLDYFYYLIYIFIITNLYYYLNVKNNVIIGVIISLLIIYYINEKQNVIGDNFISRMEKILNSDLLKDVKYFYIDSSMINFIYNIRDYKKYNKITFYKLLKTIDIIFRIEIDMEHNINYIGENLNIVLKKKRAALDYLNSFKNNIPYYKMEQLKKNIILFEKLINKHIETMYIYTKYQYQNRPITTTTTFVYPNNPISYNSFD